MWLARSGAVIQARIVFLLSEPVDTNQAGDVHYGRMRRSIGRAAMDPRLVTQPNTVYFETNVSSSSRVPTSPAADIRRRRIGSYHGVNTLAPSAFALVMALALWAPPRLGCYRHA